MEAKKPTIAIGIAAYNAESRIKELVNSLISQKETDFKITKIIIHCDNCSDNTVKISGEVSKILNDSRIEIIDNKERRGFALSCLYMMQKTDEDIFVELNDDIRISDNYFIAKLIDPILKDRKVGLTSGNLRPLKPRNFIERSVISSFNAYDRMRNLMDDKNNRFTCDGASFAFSREFINNFRTPEPISDLGNLDAYAYFACKEANFFYVYSRDAILYHRYPSTVADYIKLISRNNNQKNLIKKQFGNIRAMEYKKPKLLFLQSMLIEFIMNPIGCSFIFAAGLYARTRIGKITKEQNLIWDIVETSKKNI